MIPNTHRLKVGMFAQVALVTVVWVGTAFAQSAKRTWNFDRDPAGKLPPNFTSALTGHGTIGAWAVAKDDSAPSPPNVLAETSADPTDYRFPLAIAEDTNFKDLALSVKFKTISGKVDQGAGLVFRLKDKDNYYIVRANALEDNFRLYHVVNGRRVQFAGANFKVTSNTWHAIKVEARGNEFTCFYDGQLRFTARDETFKNAGKVGLWTKADSVIHFDDLTVEDLGSAGASAARGRTLAQTLVDELAARHPELVRIGLHLTPLNALDNVIVASNVPAKIGNKSDPEDLTAIESRKPVVLREGKNFDITLPLYDAAGNLIGAIGLTFKPAEHEKESSALERARRAARELQRLIPSKAKLFESGKS